MKKRLLCGLTLGLAALGLCSCGSGEEVDEPGVKTVKVWVHKSEAEDEGKVYSAIADQFNEEEFKTDDGTRTIRMKLEFKNSSETLSTAINAEVLTGGLPDIVAVDSSNIAAYADARILTSIDDYVTEAVRSDYVDSVIEQSTFEDKLYALSGMDAPTGLYYNKDLLKQVGYTDSDFGTTSNPWSWKDVFEAMNRLKSNNLTYKTKLNLGFGGAEGCMYLYSSLVYSSGGKFCGEDGKTAGYLNDVKALEGLKVFEKFFTPLQDGESFVYQGSNTDALAGQEVAFEIYGPWSIATIKKNYPDFENSYGIMPMPVYESETGEKGSLVGGCGSWGFGVTENSKDKSSAVKALEYLTGKEASLLMYESIGTFPTHKSLYEEVEDFKTGRLKEMSDLLNQASTPRPVMVNYPKVSAAYSNIIAYIESLYGTADYNLKSYVDSQVAQIDR